MQKMLNWKTKLDIFMKDFEHTKDAVGILACGSYITGHPTAHSDLDVHIVLNNHVNYRERGNRIIDGLLIEYFANSPTQIRMYFKEDLLDRSLTSQVQFATGEIISDTTGDIATLKAEALAMLAYTPNPTELTALARYFLWDRLDDLQDAFETNRPDFDFLYFNFLNMVIAEYMKSLDMPYNIKAILGHIEDDIVRKKYLLRELPDKAMGQLISRAITAETRRDKLKLFEQLVGGLLGDFDIGRFKFKS